MIDKKVIEIAMKETLKNAEEFLQDSRILQKKGSIGHATSLAILGFEEAHKAYLISLFHPIFDGLVSEDYRKELKSQFTKHQWKQLGAKEFRTGLELLLKSGELSDDVRDRLGIPSLSEMESDTDYAFSMRLNKMKNDGFYTDPFRKPFWCPSGIRDETLKSVQSLTETQIKSIKRTLVGITRANLIPDAIIQSIRDELSKPLLILKESQKDEIINMEELEDKLSKSSDAGKIITSVLKSYIANERFKLIEKEQKKLQTQSD